MYVNVNNLNRERQNALIPNIDNIKKIKLLIKNQLCLLQTKTIQKY